MTINLQQLTATLPLLVIVFTVVAVILSISYNRNHFFVAILSILGLMASFFSLHFLNSIISKDITTVFYIDRSSILYIGIIIISSITTCIFAYPWLIKYKFNKEEFYLLILISTLGAISLIFSNHLSSFFINIELLSLPIFGLISYSSNEKYSLEAALKYVILSSVSSSFLLLGIAWIYSISGKLSFISINEVFNVASINEKLVVLFGISMILLSIFFKLSIVPFHLWTPDIYQGTPAPVLSFFSVASKTSIFVVLLHFLSHISNINNHILYFVFSLISIFSMLFGNLMAIFQKDFKRFFGYSSISQLGYLFIAFFSLEKNFLFSSETIQIYLLSYLFSSIAFFGIINLISISDENNNAHLIPSYRGLFWSQPILGSLLTLVLLSLAGIPITLGFIAKFYIFAIIIKEHLWTVGISFLIATVLGVFNYLRIILNLYLDPFIFLKTKINIPNYWFYTPSGIVVFISGIILLIFGLYPNPLINLINMYKSF